MKHSLPKRMRRSKREAPRGKCLHQETRNLSNKQPNCISQRMRKRRTNEVSEWEERTKIMTEINEMETKRIIEKIDEAQSWAFAKIKSTNL